MPSKQEQNSHVPGTLLVLYGVFHAEKPGVAQVSIIKLGESCLKIPYVHGRIAY